MRFAMKFNAEKDCQDNSWAKDFLIFEKSNFRFSTNYIFDELLFTQNHYVKITMIITVKSRLLVYYGEIFCFNRLIIRPIWTL